MGRKRIKISTCIIEDLIYGRLCGPVKSDAPKGLTIKGVYSDVDDIINIYVEHPDFEEIGRHPELPVLEVTFTNEMDLDTQELIKKLRIMSEPITDQDQVALNIACEKLMTWDAKYYQLFEERNELRRENNFLQSKIDTIVNIVREHKSND